MKKYRVFLIVAISLFLITATATAEWHFFDKKLARTEIFSKSDIQLLVKEDLDIGSVRGNVVYLYLDENQIKTVRSLGYDVEFIPDPAREYFQELRERTRGSENELDEYFTHTELTDELTDIEALYPDICNLFSAGESIQGNELWVMEISDNVTIEEDEPEFFYIATIHGNEPIGESTCVDFIRYLTENYPADEQVQHLVDDTHIYIMPLMNPDGYHAGSRFNANGYDLNRNFPDRIDDPYNTGEGRQQETQVLMDFFATHSPIHAGVFHTGALVMNYPYDGNPERESVYTACPDDEWYIEVSLAYSIENEPMYTNWEFENGISNGADWYDIYGGIQDWSYTWMGCRNVTIELSNTYWPNENELPQYWDDNRESMLAYLEYVHQGIRGIVTDSETGDPLPAIITLDDNDIEVFTDPDVGDYYRLLLPGTYNLHVYSYGYEPVDIEGIVVGEDALTRQDIELVPLDPGYLFEDFEDGDGGYTHEVITPGDNDQWHYSDERSYSGTHSWKCGSTVGGNYFNNNDAGLITPVIDLEPNSVLSFWHYLDSEVSGTYYPYAYDAGVVEIRESGNPSWTMLSPEGGFHFVMRNLGGNGPIPHDTPVFAGHIDGREARFDLSGYEGAVEFRFRFVSDGSVTREGWYIDNVQIFGTDTPADLVLSATPWEDPVEISAGGGNFRWDAVVENVSDGVVEFDAWTELLLPNGSSYGPLDQFNDLALLPGNILAAAPNQQVPGFAPAGEYMYLAKVGNYPDAIATDSFPFTKLPGFAAGTPVGSGYDKWILSGWFDEDIEEETMSGMLPVEYQVESAYPNPFNPTTTIRVALPDAAYLNVSVYNVTGQVVATLADTRYNSGYHNLSFDARDCASGIYFVRVVAPGQLDNIQKLVLIR